MPGERKLTDRRVQRLAEDVFFREGAAALAELSALYREHKQEIDGIAHRHAITRKVLARIMLDDAAAQRKAKRQAAPRDAAE